MKFYIDYDFLGWNEYINAERTNKFIASNIKKKDLDIVRFTTINKKYKGTYPVELIVTKHFKNKKRDLDNVRLKGIIDGLVKCGVIENDNLTKIAKITLLPAFDEKDGIEIEIRGLNEEDNNN